MTAATVPVRPAEDASLRPLPWRRMAWVTWRHHRIGLGGVAVFLGALAVWLWTAGLELHHAYAAAIACHPASSAACQNLIATFSNTNVLLQGGFALQPVPALVGAFVGAPMLAREIETGTFRYAWTQGFGRWRWALAKLVTIAVAVTVAAGAFTVLVSWYYEPYIAAGNRPQFSVPSPLSPGLFDLRGVAFAAWSLAAFAIGALAGMLIRRVVPSIVATLAAYTGLALVAGNVLRQHYLAPLVAKNLNIPGSALIMSEWWTKGGKLAFGGRPPLDLLPQLCPGSFTPRAGGGINGRGSVTPTQCFVQHGYTRWASFEPASRFWPFQWIEGGLLLALSVLLVAVTVWLVRRRAV
jgi:hypothetical protein